MNRYNVYEKLTEKQATRLLNRVWNPDVVKTIDGHKCKAVAWGITEDMRDMYQGRKWLVVPR